MRRRWARRLGRAVGCAGAMLLVAAAAHGQSEQWDAAAASEQPRGAPAEEDERLRGAALQHDLPGVEFGTELPAVRVLPGFGVRFPYQMLGVGAGVELVPVPWLRVGLYYSFGITPGVGGVQPSNYAEGLVGIRLFRAVGEVAVDVPLGEQRWFQKQPPVVKAWAPANHSLFVEGGLVTGFTALEQCDPAVCSDPDDDAVEKKQQVVFSAAGLRYVYYFDIRSRRKLKDGAVVGKSAIVQVYAHLLTPPLTSTPEHVRYPNGFEAKRGFGGRVGLEAPPFGGCLAMLWGGQCATAVTVGIAVGYAPFPQIFLGEIYLTYPIELGG